MSKPFTLHPHPQPSTLHPTPSTLNPASHTLNPTPYTPHPQPYTLHPTPSTLHPTPHTLHPAPYTPHPTPHTLLLLSSGDGAPRRDCQLGTYKTVKARFWPWRSGKSPDDLSSCSPFSSDTMCQWNVLSKKVHPPTQSSTYCLLSLIQTICR